MNKRKLKQFSNAIEAAQAAFRAEIEKLAADARQEILPYFRRHGFDFRAGNGTWFISKPAADTAPYFRPEDYVKDEELPSNIRELLNLDVAYNDCLGLHIDDIKRGE